MITLPHSALDHLTGADLLDLLSQERRQGADLEIGGRKWRVYRSTCRGRGLRVNLWSQVQAPVLLPDGTDTGHRTLAAVHIRGDVGQRIMDYRCTQGEGKVTVGIGTYT